MRLFLSAALLVILWWKQIAIALAITVPLSMLIGHFQEHPTLALRPHVVGHQLAITMTNPNKTGVFINTSKAVCTFKGPNYAVVTRWYMDGPAKVPGNTSITREFKMPTDDDWPSLTGTETIDCAMVSYWPDQS